MTFARKPYKPARAWPSPIPESQRRTANMQAAPQAASRDKTEYVRSEAYRRLVASMPCANCGAVGRSQCAHENIDKGMALKNDDRRAMPLCADEPGHAGCHSQYDAGKLFQDREAHRRAGALWAAETREKIMLAGDWPAGVPHYPESNP